LGDVASSIGLQAVVGAIARTSDADFNLHRTLTALAEAALGISGAAGASVEKSRNGTITPFITIGQLNGTPRRLPIISEGVEVGFLALYGAKMFGPATADRTQTVADLAAMAFTRAARAVDKRRPAIDDDRYRLITGVGLNLRNTLGAASGYMQLVEMDSQLTFIQREYVERGRRAVNSAVSLIADLLELTRADAGRLAFEHDPVNVTAIAREVARNHATAAHSKQCEIHVTAEARPPLLLTDASHVQEIVDVLVYNAVRYSPTHSVVSVKVEARRGRRSDDPARWVCVEVADSGKGVPDAEKVFEEVHRVEHGGGNVRFKLAICRRIARLLGGDLRLESAPNAGAVFTLWLPAPGS
jgi:signal transduction histidine kinase